MQTPGAVEKDKQDQVNAAPVQMLAEQTPTPQSKKVESSVVVSLLSPPVPPSQLGNQPKSMQAPAAKDVYKLNIPLVLPFSPQQLQKEQSLPVALLSTEKLQAEIQQLQATVETMHSEQRKLQTRLEEIEPFNDKQKQQLNTIKCVNKLHIFFRHLLAGLNGNSVACLSLGSERLSYSSNKNDYLEAGNALVSAIPFTGLISGGIKAGLYLQRKNISAGFEKI